MDEKTKKALNHWSENFVQFSRNGRWGDCVMCPRDTQGRVYPEFCAKTKRYDHHLTLDDLAEGYKDTLKRA